MHNSRSEAEELIRELRDMEERRELVDTVDLLERLTGLKR